MKQGVCPHCKQDIQHWDVAWAFGMDCFQYIITKWLFRWKSKGGLGDLEKAQHAIGKYIEVVKRDQEDTALRIPPGSQAAGLKSDSSGHPMGSGYVNQDR